MFADVTRRAGGSVTVEGKPQRLAPDELGVKRATNANVAAVSNCVVQSVEFHRNSQLMLTAGFDQCLRLFSIDGLRNPLTQQVFMKDMPIHTASFTPDGKSIVMTGRRKYFYTYDLERATVQRVPRIIGREEKSLEKFVLSPDNKWIAFLVRIVLPDVLANTPFTARLRGSVSLTCRSGVLVGTGRRGIYSAVLQSDKRMGRVAEDGGQRTLPGLQPGFNDTDLGRCARLFHIARFHTLTRAGDNGELFHWDLRTRRCRHRHADAGMSPLTCLDYSDTGRFLACGSRSGVVNVYDMTKPLTGSHPKPTATVDNLTTPVSSVLFNHDAQVCQCFYLTILAVNHLSKSGHVKTKTLRLRAMLRS
jgi:U3 small nucleolar RNA-associated protein 18